MSFLNGISAAGSVISNYAGAVGLQSQKADLQNQSMQLADQLTAARESAGRVQAGDIAAAAADKQQTFQASQTDKTESGANARNAATNATSLASTQISNQGLPEYRAAQTADMAQRTAAGGIELDKVQQVTNLQKQLADEVAKPDADPDKVSSLGNQIGALGMTAASRQASQNALDSLAKTESINALGLSKQLGEETDKLGGMMLDPDARARQQKVVDDLQAQLSASRARAASLVDQARGATGSPKPPSTSLLNGTPNATSTPSPFAPVDGQVTSTSTGTTVSTGAASASGSPFDIPLGEGAVTAPRTSVATTGSGAARVTGDTVPATKPASTVSTALPGDVYGAKSLDDVKAARPELNVGALRGRSPLLVSRVLAIVDGRSTFPTSKSPDANATIALANLVDPTLDEASVKGRMATRQAFSSGAEAKNITALNTALGHASRLSDAFKALNNNSPVNFLNSIDNAVIGQFGDPRPNNAQIDINALASEARKVFAGNGGGNLTELKEWQDGFPMNGSQSQQQSALNEFVHLLQSRMDSLADQYNRGMGVTRDPTTFLEPKALDAYRKLTGLEPSTVPARQLGNSTGFSPAPTTVTPSAAKPAGGNNALQQVWGQ